MFVRISCPLLSREKKQGTSRPIMSPLSPLQTDPHHYSLTNQNLIQNQSVMNPMLEYLKRQTKALTMKMIRKAIQIEIEERDGTPILMIIMIRVTKHY